LDRRTTLRDFCKEYKKEDKMKKKYLVFLVCMLLFVAIVGEVNAEKTGPTGTGCADLQAAFSYPRAVAQLPMRAG
jgi:hypothetical protein